MQGLMHSTMQGLMHSTMQGLMHSMMQGLMHSTMQVRMHSTMQGRMHSTMQGRMQSDDAGKDASRRCRGGGFLAPACRSRYPLRMLLFCSAMAAAPLSVGAPYEEFTGLRAEAMGGAHRGLGTSNDTLFLNPAGMALAQRYSVDFAYGFTNQNGLSHLHASAVDSKSGPVAGAMGYTHDRGDGAIDANLHRFYTALAYPIVPGFALGVSGRHIRGEVVGEDISVFNGDVGVAIAFAGGISLGATYHNVLKNEAPSVLSSAIGIGAAANLGRVVLASDLGVDMDNGAARGEIDYHFGAEYFAADQFPLRLGFRMDKYFNAGELATDRILSGGAGWVNQGGALEIAGARSFDRRDNWQVMAAIKFFL
jgi:hypothetical protein